MLNTYNSLSHTLGEIPSLDRFIVWMGGELDWTQWENIGLRSALCKYK